MTTGLWIAASGLDTAALLDRVPPACRRPSEPAHSPTVDPERGDVVVTTPEWATEGATRFVPALAVLTDRPYSARLELSVCRARGWSQWAAAVGLGRAVFAPVPAVEGLDAALADWAGIENLEERMVAGQIDPLVLAHLRRLG